MFNMTYDLFWSGSETGGRMEVGLHVSAKAQDRNHMLSGAEFMHAFGATVHSESEMKTVVS